MGFFGLGSHPVGFAIITGAEASERRAMRARLRTDLCMGISLGARLRCPSLAREARNPKDFPKVNEKKMAAHYQRITQVRDVPILCTQVPYLGHVCEGRRAPKISTDNRRVVSELAGST